MKKKVSLVLSVFLLLICVWGFGGCGGKEANEEQKDEEEMLYNAAMNAGSFKEEFLKENRLSGAYYKNEEWTPGDKSKDEYLTYPDCPESRTYLIKSKEQSEEIFESLSYQVDFDTQMMVLHLFVRRINCSKVELKKVKIEEGILKIDFDLVYKSGYYMPSQEYIIVVLDKLDITEVEVY